MSAVDDILSMIDIKQLAGKLGTDPKTAKSAVEAAIPTLISGLQANAGSADGEKSLLGALAQHATGDASGQVDLDQVDTADGKKIVKHALANDPKRLTGVSNVGGDLLKQLLPMLAPIVMNYLGQRLLGGGAQAATQQSSGGLGDVLGGALGGLLGGGQQQSASGGLGDLLGGLLGGVLGGGQAAPAPAKKPAAASQSDAGDLLGGLLGQILGK